MYAHANLAVSKFLINARPSRDFAITNISTCISVTRNDESGAHIVKLRFSRQRRYRGRQPAGPAGGGATQVVLLRCSMSCNDQLGMPGGVSPLCLSFTRFIVGLCQVLDPLSENKFYQVISIAGPRLTVIP